jgi:two-component system, OmpR family, alkaline phosphatase synthesis response regulator PhoP
MSEGKPKILVVDDEAHILHVVSMKLRNAGYEVITAEDGEEALESALANKPDLVITDYQMPFLSGLELCMKLKQHEATRATPALMLTARGFGLASEYIEQTNIAGVLSKPFSPREILAKVHELIGAGVNQEATEQ